MGNNRIKIIFACDDIYQYDSLISILNNKYNIIIPIIKNIKNLTNFIYVLLTNMFFFNNYTIKIVIIQLFKLIIVYTYRYVKYKNFVK